MSSGPSPLSARQLNRLRVIEAIYRQPPTGPAAVGRAPLLGGGGALRAPMARVAAQLAASGRLPGWRGIRRATEMEARLGVPVQMENVASAGAVGEEVFGAGRGVDGLVCVR